MSLLLYAAFTAIAGLGPQQSASAQPASTDAVAIAGDASRANPDLPVSLDRIQRGLAQKPRLRTESEKPVFRVEVFGRKPTIEDILGPDYLRGPVSGGAMTHQEFLAMVTPKDVQGYAAFSNSQAFTVAATSFAIAAAAQGVQWAVHKLGEAKQEREEAAAKREVLAALAALEEARRKADLPPK